MDVVIISIFTSGVVAYLTVRLCFEKIDRYVRDTTEELRKTAEMLFNRKTD